ncbi:anti-sigma factor RsbA family regulatory protein [Actinoplanes sp. NPDC051633]|uniref:anti-sigma factor RsbA family regulatory protein n=1 Tax=Actinoplanes sp. NPDC051633 TaxID=3155670 RepID=UPI003435A86C
MRTGSAAGHRGYFHEAVHYSSDEELLAVLVPFLTGGPAAGEPTLVSLGARNAELVRSALPRGTAVEFTGGGDMYARPAAAIRSYRRLLADHVRAGARQIRIVGELPADVFGPAWYSWARYESAINHAYDDFPLWSMCAYDRRTTPPPMLADVARTHPREARPDGTHPALAAYVPPEEFLSELRPVPPDPLQLTPPSADLADPVPGRARDAVRAADRGQVRPEEAEDLVVAISEAVTNAMLHGRPPVRVRVWAGPDRIVAEVADAGQGPKDPFTGLLPSDTTEPGGRGLWIVHQSVSHVVMARDGGFALRLTAGVPH